MPTSAGVYRKKLFLSPCWSQNYTAVFKQKKSEPIMCFETVTMFHPPEKNYCSTPLGSFSLEAKTSRNGRLAQDLCGVSKVRRLICVVLKAEGFPHSYSRCARKPHGQWGFNLDQCRSYNHASHTESYRDSLTLILCTDLMKNSNSSKQMKHGFHSCAACHDVWNVLLMFRKFLVATVCMRGLNYLDHLHKFVLHCNLKTRLNVFYHPALTTLLIVLFLHIDTKC